MRDIRDPMNDPEDADAVAWEPLSDAEIDARAQREQDAELGIGLDGPDFDAADNDQRIRELCDQLLAGLGLERRSPLAEKARAIIAEHELRRAIPFGQPDEVCRHGVRYFAYCADCQASARMRRVS